MHIILSIVFGEEYLMHIRLKEGIFGYMQLVS